MTASSSASRYGFGEETSLIEMPISWSLDDYPHFEFVRTATTVLPGLQSARTVMESWLDEFRYMQKTVEWGVLTYTMHPYVIGRGYRMLAFEELVKSLAAAGAVFMTMEDAAEEAQATDVCVGWARCADRYVGRMRDCCTRRRSTLCVDALQTERHILVLHGGPLATCITRASRSMSTAPVVIVRLALGWLRIGMAADRVGRARHGRRRPRACDRR